MPYSSRAPLEGLNAADIESHRGIELQRIAARGGLGVAVGDADLQAQLVQEDHRAAGLADVAGDLPHGLTHQTGWLPTARSPISPSISARGVRAATESTTTMSTAAERTS